MSKRTKTLIPLPESLASESRVVLNRRVQNVIRSIIDKLTAIAVDITSKYALLQRSSEAVSLLDAVPKPSQLKLEFSDEDTADMVAIANALVEIDFVRGTSNEFTQLHAWAKRVKYNGEPTVLEMFVIPMLTKPDKVVLPWTDSTLTPAENHATLQARAMSAMQFMRDEGCGFFVDLILTCFWGASVLKWITRKGTVIAATEIAVPLKNAFKDGRRIGAVFYTNAPPQTGIPALMSPEAFQSARIANPLVDAHVADKAYVYVIRSLFGRETPFFSVPFDDRNRIVALVSYGTKKTSDDEVLDTFLMSITTDHFLIAIFPEGYDRRTYIARNVLDSKYGSHLRDTLVRQYRNLNRGSIAVDRFLTYVWGAAMDSANGGNHTYMEMVMDTLGSKPSAERVETLLALNDPNLRGDVAKHLIRYGVKVPHNALGDIAVASRLSRLGIKPSAEVMQAWPIETRQWYTKNVVLSQVVDELMEPM